MNKPLLTLLLAGALLLGGLASPAAAADIFNPQPAAGDLVLPMPGGAKMVFRPVAIGEGDKPFALRKFQVGDPGGGFKENPTTVVIGGAFRVKIQGRPDWVYYMAKYEVSQAQYYAIMPVPAGADAAALKKSRKPITDVSWFEVQQFLDRYNRWLYQHAADKLPANGQAYGFLRLPTEIEWEFAARGGSVVSADDFDKKHPYGNQLGKHEWFFHPSSSHGKVKDIGLLKPNPLGLHDMLGNVSEMTASLYQIEYYQGRLGGLVYRGGNYLTQQKQVRSSYRREAPFYQKLKPMRQRTLGFRPVISSIIITGLQTSRQLAAAWDEYRATSGRRLPAAVSVSPVSTQTNVKLSDAMAILARLERSLSGPGVPADAKRQLALLKASFGNIESLINKAEQESAYAWVKIAGEQAYQAHLLMVQVKRVARVLQITAGKSFIKPSDRANLEKKDRLLRSELKRTLARYSDSLRQLDRINADVVQRSFSKYTAYLVRLDAADHVRANELAKKHYMEYNQTKRADPERWRAELERL